MEGPNLIGSVLEGRYKLLERIGAGGMGAVYRAEHMMLGTQVAVKVLLPKFAHDSEWVQRFLLEARAASRIRHPHIVQIHDLAAPHPGLVYMVMELLEGESLNALAKREGPLPWPRVGRLTEQVADALAAAHARGIIHRDIKPPNVFRVGRREDPDFVKVLDFGIAKFLADPGDGEGLHTASDILMGTPEYIAPEIFEGARPDARADVYSLGVMMYRLLTGRVPFAGNHIVVAQQIAKSRPLPPSQLVRTGVVPPEVDALLLGALRREREERIASMTALLDALRALRNNKSASPDPLAPTERQIARDPATPTRITRPLPPVAAPLATAEPPQAEQDLSEESTLRRDKSLPDEPITDAKPVAQELAVVEGHTDRTALSTPPLMPAPAPVSRRPVRPLAAMATFIAVVGVATVVAVQWGKDSPPLGPLSTDYSSVDVERQSGVELNPSSAPHAPPVSMAPDNASAEAEAETAETAFPRPPEPGSAETTSPRPPEPEPAEASPPPPPEVVSPPPEARPDKSRVTPAKPIDAAPKLSRSLSSEAIVHILDAMDDKLQRECFQAHEIYAGTTLRVALTVAPSGRATVKLEKPRSIPFVACIAEQIEKYSFPRTQTGGAAEHVLTARDK